MNQVRRAVLSGELQHNRFQGVGIALLKGPCELGLRRSRVGEGRNLRRRRASGCVGLEERGATDHSQSRQASLLGID